MKVTFSFIFSRKSLFEINISIVRLKLGMDDITDAGYWKYMNATPFQKMQMQLKFFVMYPRVFEEF